MAKANQSDSRKRRKRPAETIRQQRAKSQTGNDESSTVRRNKFRWLAKPFRAVADARIWQHKAWKPVRFVFRIIGYILLVPYFRSSFRELRQVTWPNWRESWRLTWAVLVFAIFFGVIVAAVDYGLDKVFKQLILNA